MHLKVPSWLLDFRQSTSQKHTMFLLHLERMSGGSENVWLVSGPFCRILKVLMMFLLWACMGGK